MFRYLQQLLIDLLFPPACMRCGREGSWFCDACARTIPTSLTVWCPICGGAQRCNHLRAHYQSLDALLPYQELWIAEALHALKYRGLRAHGEVLGRLLAERFSKEDAVVTCIPLHRKRERNRGFNQTEVIAQSFAAALRVPFVPLLERTKATTSQVTLDAEKRWENLRNVFAPSLDAREHCVVSAKHVILIDDVVTTGATLSAASAVLRAHGAERISALAVAYSVSRQKKRQKKLEHGEVAERLKAAGC